MKSKQTPEFRKLLRALPNDVRKQALAAYRQFRKDPYHPSLQFKVVNKKASLYSARVGLRYRALGWRVSRDLIVWDWIGTHREYEKLIS